jgi:hypothetical protein
MAAGVIGMAASLGASAAILDLAQIDITAMTFSLTPSGPGGTFTVSNLVPATDTNVVDGARNPLANFDLSLNTGVVFSGPAVAYTTAALPATVDTTAGTISLGFGGTGTLFTMDWSGGAFCTSPRPDCLDIAQGPVTGTATGTWNPVTGAFQISWTRTNDGHPFDAFTSTWTWQGTAQPVPEPATYLLVLGGLALTVLAKTRRRAA